MGLQCSILGHSFESAGVEREREERDSEMVTTEREIERCRRCGTERVVSESTEVTAIVDGEAVGLEAETASEGMSSDGPEPGTHTRPMTDSTSEGDPAPASEEESTGSAFAGIVDRSGVDDDPAGETPPSDETPSTDTGGEILDDGTDPEPASPDADTPDPSAAVAEDDPSEDVPDPAEEDAEILTDDGPEREPGEWPEGSDEGLDEPETTAGRQPGGDLDDAAGDVSEPADDPAPDESLSGITVPDGEIGCPDCGFRVDAQSGYRAGDPCPECGAWLEAERNQ